MGEVPLNMILIELPCYSCLCEAKRASLLEAAVKDPSQSAILKAVTRKGLTHHCSNLAQHHREGGIQLPVYRCAQGTTFLESFHLHLPRYIYMYTKKCYCKKIIIDV